MRQPDGDSLELLFSLIPKRYRTSKFIHSVLAYDKCASIRCVQECKESCGPHAPHMYVSLHINFILRGGISIRRVEESTLSWTRITAFEGFSIKQDNLLQCDNNAGIKLEARFQN